MCSYISRALDFSFRTSRATTQRDVLGRSVPLRPSNPEETLLLIGP